MSEQHPETREIPEAPGEGEPQDEQERAQQEENAGTSLDQPSG